MSLLKDVIRSTKSLFGLGSEGAWRGPFSGMGELGGMYALGRTEDGWQRNLNVPYTDPSKVAIVYACVQAYSRAVSTCVMSHMRDINGRQTLIEDSWTARLIRKPNSYETWNQHVFNTVSELGFRGSSVDLIIRDNRNVPVALHRLPWGSWTIHIEPDTKEIFYGFGSNSDSLAPTFEPNYLIPERDVIHYRQHTPRHPLLGESPITAAALALGINVALSQSQAAFFNQMRRPSGILTTEANLNKEQMLRLRTAFDEQAKRWSQGGMPILSNGVKFQPIAITAQDSQLIDAQKMSVTDICSVYSIPLPIVSRLENATLNNSEVLIGFWLATGLGSVLENLEQSLNRAFGFYDGVTPDYINFDTASLLRSDAKSQVETLTRGIVGGLYAPNEARGKVNLPAVPGGDTVFLQQQNFPIDLLTQYAQNSVASQLQQNSAPAPDPAPNQDDNTDDKPALEDSGKGMMLSEEQMLEMQSIDDNNNKGLQKIASLIQFPNKKCSPDSDKHPMSAREKLQNIRNKRG